MNRLQILIKRLEPTRAHTYTSKKKKKHMILYRFESFQEVGFVVFSLIRANLMENPAE